MERKKSFKIRNLDEADQDHCFPIHKINPDSLGLLQRFQIQKKEIEDSLASYNTQTPRKIAITELNPSNTVSEKKTHAALTNVRKCAIGQQDSLSTVEAEIKIKESRFPISQMHFIPTQVSDNMGHRSPISLKPLSVAKGRDGEEKDELIFLHAKDRDHNEANARCPVRPNYLNMTIKDTEMRTPRSPLCLRPLVIKDNDPQTKSFLLHSPLGSPTVTEGQSPISRMNDIHSNSVAVNTDLSSSPKTTTSAFQPEVMNDIRASHNSETVLKSLDQCYCKLCGRAFMDATLLAEHEKGSQHRSLLQKHDWLDHQSSSSIPNCDLPDQNQQEMVMCHRKSCSSKVFLPNCFEHNQDSDFTQLAGHVDSVTVLPIDFNGKMLANREEAPIEIKKLASEMGSCDLRWEKVKAKLIQDLCTAEAHELSEIMRKISRAAEYQALASTVGTADWDRKKCSEELGGGKDSLDSLSPDVIKALRVYLSVCLSSEVTPAHWFLADPGRADIILRGCLLTRPSSFASLCKVLEISSWISVIDVSHNDLKAASIKMLAKVLSNSQNQIIDLNIAGNSIMDSHAMQHHVERDSNISTRFDGVISDLGLLLSTKTCLTILSLAHNNMGDAGLCDFAKIASESDSLVNLDLSFNAGSQSKRSLMSLSGPEIAKYIAKSTSLQSLNLRWNTIGGAGAVSIGESLKSNTTMTRLDLSWNSFGSCRAVEAIAQSLTVARKDPFLLKDLNLSYNSISDHRVLVFSEYLPTISSLTSLNLDGNPLMMTGIAAIRKAIMQLEDLHLPPEVSMLHCGAESKMAEAFDVLHPAGFYTLDLSEDYNRIVIKKLVQIAVEGGGEFETHTVTLDDKPFSLTIPAQLPLKFKENLRDTPMPPSTSTTGTAFPRKLDSLNKLLTVKSNAVLICGSNIPVKGMLKFEFGEVSKAPVDSESLSAPMLQSLMHTLESSELSSAAVQAIISSFLSGRYISSVQADQIISHAKGLQIFGNPVVMLAIQLHGKLSDPENVDTMRGSLSDSEAAAFQKFVGPMSFVCTFNNPTGHYSLDLSNAAEREIASRLIAWKNREASEDERLQAERPQVGLPKLNFDRHWRNARLNGHVHHFTPSYCFPASGRFELDLVESRKPRDEDNAIEDSHFETLLDEQWHSEDRENPELLVSVFRDLSNSHFFSCKQVQRILIEVTKVTILVNKFKAKKNILLRWTFNTLAATFTFWRFENRSPKSFSRLICLGNDGIDPFLFKIRGEIMVTAFARTIDWHGLGPWIIDHLSVREKEDLEYRIGKYNLFDQAVAVSPYTLNLSNMEDRRILQELIHLAEIEEGRNFMDVMYNEKEISIPSTWKKEVPTKGILRLCFCRGPEACRRILTKYQNSPSWPVGFKEHCGVGWVAAYRLKRVQERLHRTFTDAESSFKKMDLDGDGILSATELAVGLFKVGLWLAPQEVQALVRALDVDGTDDIDIEEWRRFYCARRISTSEFVQTICNGHGKHPAANGHHDVKADTSDVVKSEITPQCPHPALTKQKSLRVHHQRKRDFPGHPAAGICGSPPTGTGETLHATGSALRSLPKGQFSRVSSC